MKKFLVIINSDCLEFDADHVGYNLEEDLLRVIKDHLTIAEFRFWNYWYEDFSREIPLK